MSESGSTEDEWAVTNAQNLRFDYSGPDDGTIDALMLFIDLNKSCNKAQIAICTDGKLGDLPLTVTKLKLLNSGGSIMVKSAVDKLRNFTGPRVLGDGVEWTVNDSILQINVFMDAFPAMAAEARAGELVPVVSLQNVSLQNLYKITLELATYGQAQWPSPGTYRSLVREDLDSVARELNLDSVSPQGDFAQQSYRGRDDRRDAGEVQRGIHAMGPSLSVNNISRNDIVITVYPDTLSGNYFTTDLLIDHVIGVRLTVVACDTRDTTWRHNVVNVRVVEVFDDTRRTRALEIHFDSEKSYGTVDLNKMLINAGTVTSSKTTEDVPNKELVATCSSMRVGRYEVSLSAYWNEQVLPTAKEVLLIVSDVLDPLPTQTLGDLQMDNVRSRVFDAYPFMRHVPSEMQFHLDRRVWWCTREYLCSRIMGMRIEYSDYVDNLLDVGGR